MKNLILSAFLSLCCTNVGLSQFSFTPFLGANSSWQIINSTVIAPTGQIINTLTNKSSNVLLPYIGFQLQIHNQFDQPIDFNFETQLSYKGRYEEDIDYTLKLLYFELTPSVNVKLYKQLRIAVGPYVGRRLLSFDTYIPGSEFERLESWDFGGMVSVSYSIKNLQFRIGYYHGKFSVSRDRFFFDKAYNRAYQFGLGYTLITRHRENKPLF